jgi:hypothetical protein
LIAKCVSFENHNIDAPMLSKSKFHNGLHCENQFLQHRQHFAMCYPIAGDNYETSDRAKRDVGFKAKEHLECNFAPHDCCRPCGTAIGDEKNKVWVG